MTYTSDVIKNAASKGFEAVCGKGKKLVRFYICHNCKGISMFKARKGKETWYACKCGYRKNLTDKDGKIASSLY